MNDTVVYAHKRKSDNQTFYIGIGQPNRPYYVHARSNFWNNYTNKHDWYVEILAENMQWDEACKMEIDLISKHGRRDKGEGPLLNQTKGGDGVIDRVITDETREKMSKASKAKWQAMSPDERKKNNEHLLKYCSQPMSKRSYEVHMKRVTSEEWKKKTKEWLLPTLIGREWSDERRKAWSEHMKGKYKGGKHVFAKAVLNTDTGEVYDSVSTAAETLGFSRPYVQRCLRGKEGRKNLVWLNPKDHDERMSYSPPPPPRTRGCYCTETGKEWSSVKEACEELGLNHHRMYAKLKGKRPNNTTLKYKTNGEKH